MTNTLPDITSERIDERTAVVHPTGIIDDRPAIRLRNQLLDLHRDGVTQYVIDLAGVQEIGRTGLSVLYRAWRRAIHNSGGLSYAAPSPAVRATLDDIRQPGLIIDDAETALHRTMATV